MSEHPEPSDQRHAEPSGDASASTESVSAGEPTGALTGHPVVDEVLQSMQGLAQRPVEEHVAIFEAAHEKLRAALTDAGDRPDGPRG